MDAARQKRLEARAGILKAMAHPTRLLLIEELTDGPRCVCELQQVVEAEMSTVSRHLAVLRNAGLVESEKQGTSVIYSLRTPCILNSLSCVETVLRRNAEERQALV